MSSCVQVYDKVTIVVWWSISMSKCVLVFMVKVKGAFGKCMNVPISGGERVMCVCNKFYMLC